MPRRYSPSNASRKVAQAFGKRHGDVLRAVDNCECGLEFSRRNFAPRDFVDGRGKTRREIEMTKAEVVNVRWRSVGGQLGVAANAYPHSASRCQSANMGALTSQRWRVRGPWLGAARSVARTATGWKFAERAYTLRLGALSQGEYNAALTCSSERGCSSALIRIRNVGMIPGFGQTGVIPPYVGDTPAEPGAVSPYLASMTDLIRQFGTTPARIQLLQGLLDYRGLLRSLGISSGFQWIDGSFLEDCESLRERPPGDIDLVTFALRPDQATDDDAWNAFVSAHPAVFEPDVSKAQFHCDAYYVDLILDPEYVVQSTAYWNGLFSHQRETDTWKGMVQISLMSDDTEAQQMLAEAPNAEED